MTAANRAAKNVLDRVAANNLCVGCGVCAGVCPAGCLTIRAGDDGDLGVVRSGDCSDCGLCCEVCPFEEHDIDVDALGAARCAAEAGAQHDAILGHYLECGMGYSTCAAQRGKSASGGLVTEALAGLLRWGEVDAVGLVQFQPHGDRYCQFTVARTEDDVRDRAGSAYYPVAAAQLVQQIAGSPERWAVVALPCLAQALRLAMRRIPRLRERIRYIFALACGTLPNDYFTELLLSRSGALGTPLSRVRYRGKHDAGLSADFDFVAHRQDGSACRPVLLTGQPLMLWAHGCFRTNACSYCDDVFGETADASFMDAWLPEYTRDPRGTNLAIVRSPDVRALLGRLRDEGTIVFETIAPERVRASQGGAIGFKRELLPVRLAWARRHGIWYPRRRVTERLGSLKQRVVCATHRRVQQLSKRLWPSIGRKLGWRVFVACLWPWRAPLLTYTWLARLRRNVYGALRRPTRPSRGRS